MHMDTGTPGQPLVEVRMDTVWVHDTISEPGPVVVREVVCEVPAAVDTDAILADYYTRRILSDTLHLRDVATVCITDTLFRNDIVGRAVTYDLAELTPEIICHNVPRNRYPARLALSAGVQLGRGQAAVAAGVRIRRAELLGAYDLRLHAPSITLKYDILQWQ